MALRSIGCWISLIGSVVIGVVFGLTEALLWNFGFITAIHAIVPYAVADALLIFLIASAIAIWIGSMYVRLCLLERIKNTCFLQCLARHVGVVMIAAAIFLIFVQIFVGMTLSLPAKAILAFVGSLSFWVMFTTFLSTIISLMRPRLP